MSRPLQWFKRPDVARTSPRGKPRWGVGSQSSTALWTDQWCSSSLGSCPLTGSRWGEIWILCFKQWLCIAKRYSFLLCLWILAAASACLRGWRGATPRRDPWSGCRIRALWHHRWSLVDFSALSWSWVSGQPTSARQAPSSAPWRSEPLWNDQLKRSTLAYSSASCLSKGCAKLCPKHHN